MSIVDENDGGFCIAEDETLEEFRNKELDEDEEAMRREAFDHELNELEMTFWAFVTAPKEHMEEARDDLGFTLDHTSKEVLESFILKEGFTERERRTK